MPLIILICITLIGVFFFVLYDIYRFKCTDIDIENNPKFPRYKRLKTFFYSFALIFISVGITGIYYDFKAYNQSAAIYQKECINAKVAVIVPKAVVINDTVKFISDTLYTK